MPRGQLSTVLSGMNGTMLTDRSWAEVMVVTDKVHIYVCRKAKLTDIRLLLKRNNLWNDAVETYVCRLVFRCVACRSTAPPQPSRNLSIWSLSKNFNDIVCNDRYYLESVPLTHCMDATIRYSAVSIASRASMDDAVFGSESC